MFVTRVADEFFLNINSVVSGSKTAPPKIIHSRNGSFRSSKVVIHIVDQVATPVVLEEQTEVLRMIVPQAINNLKYTGRAFSPFNPGEQTGKILKGPQFYTRSTSSVCFDIFLMTKLHFHQEKD